MSVGDLLKNTNEYTLIRVVRNDNTGIFLLKFYARWYHGYVKVWNATINDSLQRKIEENKELHLSAVVFMMTDLNNKQSVMI